MKLLVPTDFSENAYHAATYATTLVAHKPGSSMHLIHVVTPVVSDSTIIYDIQEQATKALATISEELQPRCSNCKISYSVSMGDTIEEINKTAKDKNVGMIVMGVQGLSKSERFIFGSNTVSVVSEGICPVIAVPETADAGVPKKIVFATDYYDSDLDTLQHILPIAIAFNSEIIMVHIFDEKDDEQSESEMIKFISNKIFKTVEYPRITYRVYYGETTPKGIRSFCETTGADLLVVSARHQNVFQKLFDTSISKELIYNSTIPMAIFHVRNTP